MITEIGIVAGEIWRALDERGECSFDQLCVMLDRPRELILMSLGWLCREGHVKLIQQNQSYMVRLRQM